MSDKIKIEKNVQMPRPHLDCSKWPFAEMEVGDSFFIALGDGTGVARLRTAVSWYGKRNSKKFTVRKWKDGYRCWRVE